MQYIVVTMWVPPFGNLWITGYLRLPKAYRSLTRPSSAPSAKAFTMRPYYLDLCFVYLHKQTCLFS